MNEKVLLHIRKNQRKESIASLDKCGLFQMQMRGLGGNAILEIVFPALKLTQNCCVNMNISFS